MTRIIRGINIAIIFLGILILSSCSKSKLVEIDSENFNQYFMVSLTGTNADTKYNGLLASMVMKVDVMYTFKDKVRFDNTTENKEVGFKGKIIFHYEYLEAVTLNSKRKSVEEIFYLVMYPYNNYADNYTSVYKVATELASYIIMTSVTFEIIEAFGNYKISK